MVVCLSLVSEQDMYISSNNYNTPKDVLCWDCSNLIKNIYENAIVWRKFERKGGLFTFEKTVIVAAS